MQPSVLTFLHHVNVHECKDWNVGYVVIPKQLKPWRKISLIAQTLIKEKPDLVSEYLDYIFMFIIKPCYLLQLKI